MNDKLRILRKRLRAGAVEARKWKELEPMVQRAIWENIMYRQEEIGQTVKHWTRWHRVWAWM